MTAQKNIHGNDDPADQRLKAAAGKNNPFRAPEGYFESFPERMLEISKQADQGTRARQRIRKTMIWSAAAAVLLLAAWGASIWFQDPGEEEDLYAEFTILDAYQLNLNHLAQLEDEYLISLLEEENISGLFTTDIDDTDISDDAIIEYLLTENHIEYQIANLD